MNPQHKQFDVVVVGASIGGCATAILFAQRGLSVALLERTDNLEQYKKLCTHFLQPVAMPTIHKLGLAERIEEAGGLRNELEVYTQWGWIRAGDPDEVGYGYNIRRQTLDPILRELAEQTAGVTFLPGHNAVELLRDGAGRVAGVTATGPHGKSDLAARLVVAADGRLSGIAKLAGLPARESENDRVTFFTYYRDLPLNSEFNSQYWHLHPDLAYAFRNDDNTTLLGVFLPRERLREFQEDPERNFRRFWDSVPEGPRIGDRQPSCPLRGITKINNHRRHASAPGLALVGDAATVTDPIWGSGCSFAMLAADWLVEAAAPAIACGKATALDRALTRYGRQHQRRLWDHYWHIASFSKLREPFLSERMIFSTATRDPRTADRVLKYFARRIGLAQLIGPASLARIAAVNLGLTRTRRVAALRAAESGPRRLASSSV